jgi:hypothetical protein
MNNHMHKFEISVCQKLTHLNRFPSCVCTSGLGGSNLTAIWLIFLHRDHIPFEVVRARFEHMAGHTDSLSRILTLAPRERNRQLVATGLAHETTVPGIICTTLPGHWRVNKSLPETFFVYSESIADGVTVRLSAYDDTGIPSEVRNDTACFQNTIAKFNDLRFLGKSGRGVFLSSCVN